MERRLIRIDCVVIPSADIRRMLRLPIAPSCRATAATLTLALLAIGSTPDVHADVFRCVESGKTIYQDTPCKSQGQAIDVTNARIPEGAADKANAALDRLRTSAAAQESERRSIDNTAELGRLERQLDGYARAEEAELAPLRSTLGYLSFNMAGAAWERAQAEASIRKKMQTVTDQYESKKQPVRERIAQLRAQFAAPARSAPAAAP
jgi:hypothetical protein